MLQCCPGKREHITTKHQYCRVASKYLGSLLKRKAEALDTGHHKGASRKKLMDTLAHQLKGQVGDASGQGNAGDTTDTALTTYTFCW